MNKYKRSSNHSSASIETYENENSCSNQFEAKRKILLNVYYTSILRDQNQMQEEQVIKKQYEIEEDSYVLYNKENWKLRIIKKRNEAMRMITQNEYNLVAEVKFQQKDSKKIQTQDTQNIEIDKSKFFSLSKTIEKQQKNNNINLLQSFQQKIQDKINSSIFFTVKSNINKSQIYPIHNKDLVKFGKQIYQVKIHSQSTHMNKKIKVLENSQFNESVHYQQLISSGIQCKICLMTEGQHQKDYIVSPCKCSGSCSAIHLECLKHWISQKIQISKKQKKITTYDMSKFECQICKISYPKIIKIGQDYIDIIPELSFENNDILILQKIYPIDSKRLSHFINLSTGQKISIGRNNENELMLEDMSVSRFHAEISKGKDGKYYLYDRDSRFGTFISLNQRRQNLSSAVLMTIKQTLIFKMIEYHHKYIEVESCESILESQEKQ